MNSITHPVDFHKMTGCFDQEVLVNSRMVDIVSEGSKNTGQKFFRFERVNTPEVGEETVKSLCYISCVCCVVERVFWLVVLF